MTVDVAPGILLEDEEQSIAKGLTPKTERILSKTSLTLQSRRYHSARQYLPEGQKGGRKDKPRTDAWPSQWETQIDLIELFIAKYAKRS
jgi:hypothetical protein